MRIKESIELKLGIQPPCNIHMLYGELLDFCNSKVGSDFSVRVMQTCDENTIVLSYKDKQVIALKQTGYAHYKLHTNDMAILSCSASNARNKLVGEIIKVYKKEQNDN